MVYRRGLFVELFLAAILVVAATSVEAGATKIAYKKPIYGKTNAIKEKHLKQKPEINRKGSATTATTQPPPPPPVIAPTIEALEPTATTTPMPTTINSTEASSPAASANATTHEQQEIKSSVSKNDETAAAIDGEPTEQKSKENNSNESDAITFDDDSADADEAKEETLAVQLPMPATTTTTTTTTTQSNLPVPCTCGIFMTSQIKRGSSEPPQGMPVIMNELDRNFPCNPIGQKQCQTKCLETIVQHLPNSANILCATLNRDCRKERAYLFVKNCHNHWWNTNLAAGREYCCRSGQPYPCPMV